MKRTALITITTLFLISSGLAVVGHNNSGDNQMGITSTGGSSSATTSVGPNGTEYSAKVMMEGTTSANTSDRIRSESISSSGVQFNGTIQASTPCHVIDHEITETQDGYNLNIKTVKENIENRTCTQVLTGINYNAEFEGQTGFTLQVQHNGQTLNTYDTVHNEEENKDQEIGLIQAILNLLGL